MEDAPLHVLLLHGMGCGPWVWRDVIAQLPRDVTPVPAVIAGHRDGTPLLRLPDRVAPEQMVDDLERQLDELGIGRLHVVGNSLGGWLALRLAERGRAFSVLGLAPAGGWHPGSAGERLIVSRFVLGHHVARRLARSPWLLTRPRVRQAVLAPVVRDPNRISITDARRFIDDLADCQALRAALGHPEARRLTLIGKPLAPVTIAWSGDDRVLSGPWARSGFHHLRADVREIAGVGHVPMLDDPALIATLIEERVATALGAN